MSAIKWLFAAYRCSFSIDFPLVSYGRGFGAISNFGDGIQIELPARLTPRVSSFESVSLCLRSPQEQQRHQREKHHRKQAGADEGCACRCTDHTEESSDLNCGHDEAQRRRLQEARSDRPAIAEYVTVQQRWYPPHQEERKQEDRHPDYGGSTREQSGEVELNAAGDEEDGDEEPVADPLQLQPEVGVSRSGVGVHDPQDYSGHERPQDRLQSEPL